MLNPDKVIRFLSSAETISTHSKDPRTKVGAIILDPEYGIVSSGWNDLPRGVEHVEDRYTSPTKYKWIVHAETNAIANAARRGIALKNCTLLVAHNIICAQCCAIAIQSGIKSIYCQKYDVTNDAHYRLVQDYLIAQQMMEEAQIEHVTY